ncbi:PREDICTED: ADP-ribose pyrophosphatase, mitochondrial-like [Rhagoletis zephyria]|uniref:ADP-ribose pyrophosphatase, mitochondrial-like n=1 Tax=Rhagoletis zephyria TaxID=28612 RepID=UPI000811933C|nr:PREDICTED: ADP-ribose pyrophosphatase, mitochondrial-like [Rhagoletis zephyria]
MPNNIQLYHYGNKVVSRALVPKDKKHWSVTWKDYSPVAVNVDFENKLWADPQISDSNFKPAWNQLDGKVDRRSHTGKYLLDNNGYPLNPTGRTGINLRGVLGRWGPNHAADPIVTRWKKDANKAQMFHPISKLPILQFIAILRSDVNEWAIPGGMVDAGEQVSATLKREFCEESLNMLEMSPDQRKALQQQLKSFFNEENGKPIYSGYVEDPRNTDNAWMETVAVEFHDQNDIFDKITLNAGDDAKGVRWVDIDRTLNLYANHLKFIEMTVNIRNGHW